jgi:hypothetical protein
MTPELDHVQRPAYLGDLPARSIEDIRAMRLECQGLENSLSYVRRLVQGRMDVVGGELQRRRTGGAAGDLADLVDRLPEILAEHSRGPGGARPPLDLDPDSPTVARLSERLDEIGARGVAAAEQPEERALEAVLDELLAFEREVSASRRHLHEIIDVLRDELTRRYRTGEASVDALLRQT